MRIAVITLFPGMFAAVTGHGVTGRAFERGLLRLDCFNPRDFAGDRRRTVDDRPFGGGPGMLMKTGPLVAAIRAAKEAAGGAARVLCMSPQGRPLAQPKVARLAALEALVLVCGRYQGIDARVIESEVDEEISLGDFVLSGGEPAAMALVDAVARLRPGVLGDGESARRDSLSDGLLGPPQYTRPRRFAGREVPGVLMSGDHGAIERWRRMQGLGATWLKRPDLLEAAALSEEQRRLLERFKKEFRDAGTDPGRAAGDSVE